ncbi:MAG: alpha/beta hydrolase [Chloroflexi bacterium]|nr:MAG: alpha/beta hydrolase [Chloroflexota bacterium]
MYGGPQWPRDDNEDNRYLGLSALQLDIAFFIVAVAVALAVWWFAFDGWTPGSGDDRKSVQANPTLPAGKAAYDPAPCPFTTPTGRSVTCGYLRVPENRAKRDNGRIVRLAVAVFKTSNPQPKPDPVVYLNGGPGGDTLEMVPYAFEAFFEPFLGDRDLILLDQRGAGLSEPSLDCPENREAIYATLDKDLSVDEAVARDIDAVNKCRDRLTKLRVDLPAYNSAENASDVDDLRVALGYDQWNLYGASYGTRLALTVMRDHPQGVRSVILDSTVPLEADLYADLPAGLARSLDRLFSACAADRFCAGTYPNLESVFYQTAAQLDREPAHVRATDPISLRTFSDVVVNGDTFVSTIFQGLYSEQAIPVLPEAIYETAAGNYGLLAQVLGNSLTDVDIISTGMYLSVQCSEEVPFSSAEKVQAAAANFPALTSRFDYDSRFYFSVCPAWVSVPPADKENQPVNSGIPTLVTAGEFDPITPPSWGQQVAGALSHSYFFQFPGLGHGVATSGDCPTSITLAFLDDPSVHQAPHRPVDRETSNH